MGDSKRVTVEKFTESISFDKQLYKHDIRGSKAHASMLAKQGLISVSDRDSILKDMVGEPAKKLHSARSRNDQVLTDFRLWCRDAIDRIVASIGHLQVALVELALKNEGLIIPGYTHTFTEGTTCFVATSTLSICGAAQPLRSKLERLEPGCMCTTGTGLPIDRFMTSYSLGFTAPIRSSIDAVSDRDFVLEFLSTNSMIKVHLSRLGEECVLWASEEFGFITPSDSISSGSSIMPQKKIPDPMELVRGKSARVIGDLVTLLTLCKGLPLAYNRDLQGIPFRTSHDIVGRSVALCVSKNCLSLDELRSVNPVFDDDVYEFLGVENTVKKFSSHGSTDSACVANQIDYWVAELELNRSKPH
ncbi:hypothetical protein PTKIN_Ptkin01aG0050400 [Pterospermum kingtungense]